MSKKKPVIFVDLNLSHQSTSEKTLFISRIGAPFKSYKPSSSELSRIATLLRRSGNGETSPFADGWLWEAKER